MRSLIAIVAADLRTFFGWSLRTICVFTFIRKEMCKTRRLVLRAVIVIENSLTHLVRLLIAWLVLISWRWCIGCFGRWKTVLKVVWRWTLQIDKIINLCNDNTIAVKESEKSKKFNMQYNLSPKNRDVKRVWWCVQMVKYLHWRRWNTRRSIDRIAYTLRFGPFWAVLHRLLLSGRHHEDGHKWWVRE